MAVRFEIAHQIGYNGAALFTPPAPTPPPARAPTVPEMAATQGMTMMPKMPAMPMAPAKPETVPAVPLVVPQIRDTSWFAEFLPSIRPATRDALAAATSPGEWNALFLSSPYFMLR
jgi:hypothetical protein